MEGIRGRAMVYIAYLFKEKAALELALKHRSKLEMWRFGGRHLWEGHSRVGD